MSRTEDVITAYESWDPDEESSTELAERLGISKARLYQILDREGITPKARRPRDKSPSRIRVSYRMEPPDSLAEHIAIEIHQRLEYLRDEVADMQRQLSQYRALYGPLNSED